MGKTSSNGEEDGGFLTIGLVVLGSDQFRGKPEARDWEIKGHSKHLSGGARFSGFGHVLDELGDR